jgi:hypothetical protein
MKCYDDIFVRLRIYSVKVKIYQHGFLASLPGTNNPGDNAKKCQQGPQGRVNWLTKAVKTKNLEEDPRVSQSPKGDGQGVTRWSAEGRPNLARLRSRCSLAADSLLSSWSWFAMFPNIHPSGTTLGSYKRRRWKPSQHIPHLKPLSLSLVVTCNPNKCFVFDLSWIYL